MFQRKQETESEWRVTIYKQLRIWPQFLGRRIQTQMIGHEGKKSYGKRSGE